LINLEALFKISYGLYIVSSGDKTRGNGFISNTVFQVTSDPPQIASCCSKNNFTLDLIFKSNAFSVSVLQKDTPSSTIENFGYKSGKNFNKLKGYDVNYGITGVPVILNDTMAYFECRVINSIDVGSHVLFVGELVQSKIIDLSKEVLTYSYFREVKKGIAPKNAPTYFDTSKFVQITTNKNSRKFKCKVCGYIYDEAEENEKYDALPHDWVCPICAAGKEDFIEI